MSDTYVIIKLNILDSSRYGSDYLVIVKEPMSYIDSLRLEFNLKELNYHGTVIFDYLLRFGNDKLSRIDVDYFNGTEFICNDNKIKLPKYFPDICKLTCDYLRLNPELMNNSALTSKEKELIMKGYYLI